MKVTFIHVILVVLVACTFILPPVSGGRKNKNRKKNRNRDQNEEASELATPTPTVVDPQTPTPLTCEERASCSGTREKDFHESNCFCDDLCEIYDDCCEDFMRSAKKLKVKINKKQIQCTRDLSINPSNDVEIYIVDQCPRGYIDDLDFKDNCENPDSRDRFLSIPVTGTDTKILYKNYYCALCSGEKTDRLSFWHLKLECSSPPLGANMSDKVATVEQTLQDTSCNAKYFHPEYEARKCKSNIDHCVRSWSGNKRVKKKCRAYTSYMYVGLEVFRNRYCAQCMDINATYMSCVDNRTPTRPLVPPPELPEQQIPIVTEAPFTVLLDTNSGFAAIQDTVGIDGEEQLVRAQNVVELKQCLPDHVYDPYQRDCRRIRCDAGTVYKDDQCQVVDGYVDLPIGTTHIMTTTRMDDVSYPEEEEGREEDEEEEEPYVITIPEEDYDDYDEGIEGLIYGEAPDWDDDIDDNDKGYDFDPNKGYVTPDPLDPEPPEPENPEMEEDPLSKDTKNEDGARPEFFFPDHDASEDGPGQWDLQGCPLLEFNDSEWFILSNNSAYVKPLYKAIEPTDYKVYNGFIFVCAPPNWHHNSTFMGNLSVKVHMFDFDRYQDLVSFVGLIVSITALLVVLVVYLMLPPLRNTPGGCVMSLVVCLLLGQGLLLASGHVSAWPVPCLAVAASMHYVFLAGFCWVNVLAIDICHTFHAKHAGSQPRSSPACRMTFYSLYAWLAPALLVGGSVCLDLLAQMLPRQLLALRPHYGEGQCFITRLPALLFLFALPLAILILVNIVLHIITLVYVCRVRKHSKTVTLHNGHYGAATPAQNQKDKDRNRFLLYIKLSLLMALTWVSAFLPALTNWWYLWYVFIGFNMLQGAFICFAFVCTRKVFRLLKERGKVHRTAEGNDYYGTSSAFRTGYGQHTYLYDSEPKIISQETSI